MQYRNYQPVRITTKHCCYIETIMRDVVEYIVDLCKAGICRLEKESAVTQAWKGKERSYRER